MDVLTDFLQAIELRGAVYFRCAFTAPWGLEMQRKPVAEFHLVVSGSCYLGLAGGGDSVLLHPGDIVLFPHGQEHVLVDVPGSPAAGPEVVLPDGMPEHYGPVIYGGGGEPADIICGYFDFDRRTHRALLAALPDFIHIRSEAIGEDFPWLQHTSRFIDHEVGAMRPGNEAVVNRLVEVLFIQIMRAYIASGDDCAGLLGAMADKRLGLALAAMHREPGRAWTLATLGREAGMSRSAFAAAFQEQVGQTPMQYLTEWRMLKARNLLAASHQSMTTIAEACGYQSEASFGKAFKRCFGISPGSYRRQAA